VREKDPRNVHAAGLLASVEYEPDFVYSSTQNVVVSGVRTLSPKIVMPSGAATVLAVSVESTGTVWTSNITPSWIHPPSYVVISSSNVCADTVVVRREAERSRHDRRNHMMLPSTLRLLLLLPVMMI
jgi:hypothetical protein